LAVKLGCGLFIVVKVIYLLMNDLGIGLKVIEGFVT